MDRSAAVAEVSEEIRAGGVDRLGELAAFLRSRRERLNPSELGLPAQPRRRTNGLRREEIAELAGISTSWYTWLEQGRDINPSRQTLDRIARALRLTPEEHAHLLQLAQPHEWEQERPEYVPPTLERMLRTFHSAAYVIGCRWDVLAWNAAACDLLVDFAATPRQDRNLLRYMFLDPRMQNLFVDWEMHARRMVAQFRPNLARYPGDPKFSELVADLRAKSEAFNALWANHDVEATVGGVKRLRHPTHGDLAVEYVSFRPDDAATLRLILYSWGPRPLDRV
jgi:transcriptional regulator with XRE-family HTH domain